MIRWHSCASPLRFQKYILRWQLLCTLEVEMAVPCMLHCCFCRANVRRNLVSAVLHTMQRTNRLSLVGCSHRCCKRRAFAPPMGSAQVSGPFLPTLYTWRCTQRLWISRSCIHSCRSAAGLVISSTETCAWVLEAPGGTTDTGLLCTSDGVRQDWDGCTIEQISAGCFLPDCSRES